MAGLMVSTLRGKEEDFDSKQLKGQIIKLERINAHLVNERTYLAYLRVVMSTLQTAIFYLAFYLENGSKIQSLMVCGGVFVLACPFTWFIGWYRYDKLKRMLTFSLFEMLPHYFSASSSLLKGEPWRDPNLILVTTIFTLALVGTIEAGLKIIVPT